MRQPVIELGNTRTFVEVRMPVRGRPTVSRWPKQFQHLGLMPRQLLDHSRRRRRSCVQQQVFAVGGERTPAVRAALMASVALIFGHSSGPVWPLAGFFFALISSHGGYQMMSSPKDLNQA